MWDQRYSASEYVYGKEPNDFLASMAGQIQPGTTLCLADGEGRNGVFLATRGHRVTAVDSSHVGLQKANRLAVECGVSIETVHNDLAHYPILPSAWDNIVSIFCHLPSKLRQEVHRSVVAGLRPGGHFILEAYTVNQLKFGTGGPKDEDRLMRLVDVEQELAGLHIELAQEIEREVIEGHFHDGKGAVLQILAIKP